MDLRREKARPSLSNHYDFVTVHRRRIGITAIRGETDALGPGARLP